MHGPERNVRMCMSFEIQLLETLYTPVCVFTLFSACAHVCVCVCVSVVTHTGALTYLCPPGMTLKICGSSSLLVSEQRLSALHSRPCGPPSPSFVTPVPSIPPSITPSSKHSTSTTHTHAHKSTNYTQLCPYYTSTEDDLCSAVAG